MKKWVVLEKKVGQTPLECAELWRAEQPLYQAVPLAYAGRLDPMASGKLLVLIDDECKRQERYHGLDKEYEFEVLFGVQSDSGDVLGLVSECQMPQISEEDLRQAASKLIGKVTFPYPKFSSKTVQGKPLHTWTMEGRLNEITIPTYTSTIHTLKLLKTRMLTRAEVFKEASAKIESIPPVTDMRKALGNDFRRPDVRNTWNTFKDNVDGPNEFLIAKFSCTCASGTYMRTLAEEIAKKLNICGLALSIHRTHIGTYQSLPFNFGFWINKY